MEYRPDDLINRLKNKDKLPNIIVTFGEETYYSSQIAALLPDYVFGDTEAESRQITVFEKDTELKELAGVINTYPFFSGSSLVILKDEKLLGGKQDSEAKKERLEKLLKILQDVPEYCTVFISTAKLDKRSRFYKQLKEKGAVCECSSFKAYSASPWLQQQAAELGGSLEREAVELILEYLAPVDKVPLQLVRQELEKLAVYAGDRKEWTREDVASIFTALPEVSGFSLSNAILERKLVQSLELLAYERKKGTAILLLCGSILFQLRRLAKVQELQRQHYGQAQIASELSLSPYAAKVVMQQASNFPYEKVREAVLELADLNIQMRRGGRRYELLEEILIKLLS